MGNFFAISRSEIKIYNFNMKSLPRITKILKVNSFKILTIWNNAEVREINFEPLFQIWEQNNNTNLLQLHDYAQFQQVKVSDQHTLAWDNLPVTFQFKGQSFTQPLELDPDVLYENSTLIRQIDRIFIGSLLKKAREELCLTQTEVAFSSLNPTQ